MISFAFLIFFLIINENRQEDCHGGVVTVQWVTTTNSRESNPVPRNCLASAVLHHHIFIHEDGCGWLAPQTMAATMPTSYLILAVPHPAAVPMMWKWNEKVWHQVQVQWRKSCEDSIQVLYWRGGWQSWGHMKGLLLVWSAFLFLCRSYWTVRRLCKKYDWKWLAWVRMERDI